MIKIKHQGKPEKEVDMRLIDADNISIHGDVSFKASVKRVIEQQPTVQQWIPASERMPEKLQSVIACTSDEIITIGVLRKNQDSSVQCSRVPFVTQDVIAWMPLPEPYKPD